MYFSNMEQREPENDTNQKDAPELRILIKLDIIIGNINLVDQIEWDLNCKRNSPESFAKTVVEDLKLPNEFVTAIAHSIREQIHAYAKSLLLVDHRFDGQPILEDEDLSVQFLPPILSTVGLVREKKAMESYSPVILKMFFDDFERVDKELERTTRRKRRQTRGSRRTTTLPDREPIKTYRSKVPTKLDPVEEPRKMRDPLEIDEPFSDDEQASSSKTTTLVGVGTPNMRYGRRGRLGDTKYSSSLPIDFEKSPKKGEVKAAEVKDGKWDESNWKCGNCSVNSSMTPLKRPGPEGVNSLCNSCGIYYLSHQELPKIEN